MSAIEPIADAATGGILASAAEPRAGIDAEGHTMERACLNCGAALIGAYCHACGQKAHVHRSLAAFAHDLLHGVFHFEGKVWRTLPMLAWRPGELTRRYIEGQRASFVGPLPLFLFGVFLMFAVASWSGAVPFKVNESDISSGLAADIAKDERALAALAQARAEAVAAGRPTSAIDERIRTTREARSLKAELAKDGIAKGTMLRMSGNLPPWLQTLPAAVEEARRNPDLLFFKLKTNGYKYSWALIPLSLPLMWLMFPFSRRWRMYDHLIFVTYSLAFVTMLVVVGSVWNMGGLPGVGMFALIPPLHFYRQLRGAYGLSRPSALWRAVAMTVGALGIAILFIVGLVALGLYD